MHRMNWKEQWWKEAGGRRHLQAGQAGVVEEDDVDNVNEKVGDMIHHGWESKHCYSPPENSLNNKSCNEIFEDFVGMIFKSLL